MICLVESESFGQIDLATDMVPIGVRDDRPIDLPIPEGHDRAQFCEKMLAVAAAVDQHLAAARRLNEDAVSLADIQEVDMQLTIRLRQRHPP